MENLNAVVGIGSGSDVEVTSSKKAVKKSEFIDPYADVDIQPVHVGGRECDKIAVRVKDSRGEYQVAGILSTGYQLFKNSIVRDVAHDIQSRSGMQWMPLKTIWDGKKYADYWYSENPITSIQNGADYQFHLGMMVRNSYDATSRFGLEFYIMNAICTNQFIARKLMGYFAIKHTGNESFDVEDALMAVQNGANNLIKVAPRIKAFLSYDISMDDVIAASRAGIIPSSHWGTALDVLGKEIDCEKVFGLYQACTYVTSHKMNGFSSIATGDGVSEYFFGKYGIKT